MATLHYTETDGLALEQLLNCSSKPAVNDLFLLAFATRRDGLARPQLQTAAELLGGASEAQAKAVLQTLRKVILKCAYEAGMDAAGVSRQLPPATNEQLSRLITQIVCHHLAGWREELIDTQVSGPRLLDLDWRVDIKTASDELTRMAVPTCMVELQVQGAQQRKGEMAPLQNVAFEMNKEEISAMLQGLEKIRDQLAGVKQ